MFYQLGPLELGHLKQLQAYADMKGREAASAQRTSAEAAQLVGLFLAFIANHHGMNPSACRLTPEGDALVCEDNTLPVVQVDRG